MTDLCVCGGAAPSPSMNCPSCGKQPEVTMITYSKLHPIPDDEFRFITEREYYVDEFTDSGVDEMDIVKKVWVLKERTIETLHDIYCRNCEEDYHGPVADCTRPSV